jgi:hypothetical protein
MGIVGNLILLILLASAVLAGLHFGKIIDLEKIISDSGLIKKPETHFSSGPELFTEYQDANVFSLNKHNIDCGNKPISSFSIQSNPDDKNKIRYAYKCGTQDISEDTIEKVTPLQDFTGWAYLDRHSVKCDDGSLLAKYHVNSADKSASINYSCVEYNDLSCRDVSTPKTKEDLMVSSNDWKSHNIKCNDDEMINSLQANMDEGLFSYNYKCCKKNI